MLHACFTINNQCVYSIVVSAMEIKKKKALEKRFQDLQINTREENICQCQAVQTVADYKQIMFMSNETKQTNDSYEVCQRQHLGATKSRA